MRSIRSRLTRDLLCLGLAFVLLSSTALYLIAREMLVEQFDDTLRAQAQAVGALLEQEKDGLSLEAPDKLPRSLLGAHPRAFLEICTELGVPALSIPVQVSQGHLDGRPEQTKPARFWSTRLPDGREGRVVSLLFSPRNASGSGKGESVPAVLIVLGMERGELDGSLRSLVLVSVVGGALLAAAHFLLVPLVLRQGLRPLGRLAEQVSGVGASTLGHRFTTEGLPEELTPVTTRLNELLSRLEAAFERERRVSADLAHELRTPVTELRMIAESALKWPQARDAETDADALAIALHMESVITRMLELARAETGGLAPRSEEVRLDGELQAAWRMLAPRAEARGLRVSLALEPVAARADRTLLRAVLTNLLENATAHAPERGDLLLACSRTGAGAGCITISNTNPGLSEADMGHLFERFWRREESRSPGGHLGLGLSLVRSFTHAMGWTVEARLSPAGRVEFILTEKSSDASRP